MSAEGTPGNGTDPEKILNFYTSNAGSEIVKEINDGEYDSLRRIEKEEGKKIVNTDASYSPDMVNAEPRLFKLKYSEIPRVE